MMQLNNFLISLYYSHTKRTGYKPSKDYLTPDDAEKTAKFITDSIVDETRYLYSHMDRSGWTEEHMKSSREAEAAMVQFTPEVTPYLASEIKSLIEADPEKRMSSDLFVWDKQHSGRPIYFIFGSALLKWKAKEGRLDYVPPEDILDTPEAQVVQQTLPAQFMPDYHTSPNSLVAHTSIINALMDDGVISMQAGESPVMDLPVANKGKPLETSIHAAVTVVSPEEVKGRSDIKIDGSFHYTEYDRMVYDAVCTLYKYGNESHTISTEMIYRVMTGSPDARASAGVKSAITKSMQKLRHIEVSMDATDQVQKTLKRKKMELASGTTTVWKNRNMLDYEIVAARDGSKTNIVYHLLAEPILLEYSTMINQLLTSKADMLDIRLVDDGGKITDKKLKNSNDIMLLKNELWRRVLIMKRNPNTYSRTIDLEKLYVDQGLVGEQKKSEKLTGAERKTRYRYLEYCTKILDYWKARGDISGYRAITGGHGAVEKIEIEFDDSKKK